jgi:CHAT domain-containing protein/tetratricopeptide (TPR) repeat protein
MRALFLLASTILSVTITGSTRPAQRSSQDVPAEIAQKWIAANRLAFDRYQAKDYAGVGRILDPLREWVVQFSPHPRGITTLLYLANAEFRRFRYRDAMSDYLTARKQARQLRSPIQSVLSYNLSTLYFQMGAVAYSAEAAEAAQLEMVDQKFLPELLLHRARLESRRSRWVEAETLYLQAIELTSRQGNLMMEAAANEMVGEEWMRRGRSDLAEPRLTKGLRLRMGVKGASLTLSIQKLALLRLSQGDKANALRLVEQAIRGSSTGTLGLPMYQTYFARARVLSEMGRNEEALSDLRLAIQQMNDTRADQVPADALRISSEVEAREIYSLYIDVANRLYLNRPSTAVAAEALMAAETGRSLREGRFDLSLAKLPDAYASTLDQLRSAYGSLYREKTAAMLRKVEMLRLDLTEMEAESGAARPVSAFGRKPPLDHLKPGEALLVFHLGARSSTLWSATQDAVQMHALPARPVVEEQARQFAANVETGREISGNGIYSTLFSKLPQSVLKKERWLIVADGGLASVPFAAIKTDGGYLIERHSIQMLPGIWALEVPAGSWTGAAVALADPIYNRADPRRERESWFRLPFAPPAGAGGSPLARLPGTQREAESFARTWGTGSRIVNGAEATLKGLEKALAVKPAILHLATHVVPSPENPREALIALGLGPDGTPEFAGPEWIASRGARPQLVMMSGCGSGVGSVVPGEGLMGLTRAWLMAGAKIVAATRWPVNDDGFFVEAFYRNYRENSAAGALRLAQIQMIHSESYRSNPIYWAGYLLSGRD